MTETRKKAQIDADAKMITDGPCSVQIRNRLDVVCEESGSDRDVIDSRLADRLNNARCGNFHSRHDFAQLVSHVARDPLTGYPLVEVAEHDTGAREGRRDLGQAVEIKLMKLPRRPIAGTGCQVRRFAAFLEPPPDTATAEDISTGSSKRCASIPRWTNAI